MVRRSLLLLISLAALSAAPAATLAARLEGVTGEWRSPSASLRVPSADGHSVTLCLRLRAPGDTLTPMDRYGGDLWYGSGWWTGPEWCRVGRDWQHPGEHTGSVRCWRAPSNGTVAISGVVRKLHLDGDGVRVSIRRNAAVLWQAELEGKDGQGVEPKLRVEVAKGDAIRFVVERRGTHFCDTTGWDPTIAYDGGQSFTASKAWGPEQNTQGWTYEVLGDPDRDAPQPVLLGLDRSLGLRRAEVRDGAELVWSSSARLPG